MAAVTGLLLREMEVERREKQERGMLQGEIAARQALKKLDAEKAKQQECEKLQMEHLG